jgi:hypothetical protein
VRPLERRPVRDVDVLAERSLADDRVDALRFAAPAAAVRVELERVPRALRVRVPLPVALVRVPLVLRRLACLRRRRGAAPSVTDSRLTSLLKRLGSPRAVRSCTSSARLFESKALNQLSQLIGDSDRAPL